MSSKRSPQTAAKRAREQAVREKRERKEAKKLAASLAPNAPEPLIGVFSEAPDEPVSPPESDG